MERDPDQRISVCIICGNEIRNIRRCLESVKWADEIVVVDSFSTDGTYDVACEYTDKVFRQEWLGYIGQKKFTAEHAACPWVFFVDADEEVSSGLRDEIERTFSRRVPEGVNGFNCPRLVRYLGRWIRHGDWYPDMKRRLFRKAYGECGGEEPHDRISVEGRVMDFVNPLNHYTYENISAQIRQIDRFSTISATTHAKHGAPSYFTLCGHAIYRFFRCYFMKCGFLDGIPGLIVAVNVAFGTFVKYAKLWEKLTVEDK